MDKQITISGTGLGPEEQRGLTEFAEDLLTIPDLGVKSLILYGSAASGSYRPGRSDINVLAVVDRLTTGSLRSVLDPLTKGRKYAIAPFFLTVDDIRSTAEIFPLKYLAMRQHYRVLYGDDVLEKLAIGRRFVLLRIKQRIANMLLKMRRYYLINQGQRLTAMMAGQIRRFVETLGFILSLKGVQAETTDRIVEESANVFGLESGGIKELCGLVNQETALPGDEAERLYGRFLEAVEKTSRVLERME